MAKLLGDDTQTKSPGQTVADAALAGYDKAQAKKPPSMKKGGRVKKTGLHLLHKGEEVVPAKKAKSFRRKKVSAK